MVGKTIPVILAGGTGTRLWPLSRPIYPKPFLSLLKEEETFLQSTILRTASFPNTLPPIVVCHQEHRFIVAEQLRQIDIKPLAIILEYKTSNTAPAIALAAHYAKCNYPTNNLWVMPADHIIEDNAALFNAYSCATAAIENEQLVVFGVPATSPETSYGYIQVKQPIVDGSVYEVEKFIEKPNQENAIQFIQSGNYYWNCGMFVFKPDVYLKELKYYEPTIAQCCEQAMKAITSDRDFVRPLESALASCPSNSIDYAIMEKIPHCIMAVLHSPWSDVGSWDALMREQQRDTDGNVTVGNVVTHGVSNSYLQSNRGLLAVVGVDNHVVVVTDDAVLVTNKDHCQDVKKLVHELKMQNRDEAYVHLKVHRPWGIYENVAKGPNFKVKRIIVNPRQCLSLQRHKHRSEHWVIIAGSAAIINGDDALVLKANESTFIPPNNKHRLANNTNQPLELIEVQVGEYLEEDDIERFEDIYGREAVPCDEEIQ